MVEDTKALDTIVGIINKALDSSNNSICCLDHDKKAIIFKNKSEDSTTIKPKDDIIAIKATTTIQLENGDIGYFPITYEYELTIGNTSKKQAQFKFIKTITEVYICESKPKEQKPICYIKEIIDYSLEKYKNLVNQDKFNKNDLKGTVEKDIQTITITPAGGTEYNSIIVKRDNKKQIEEISCYQKGKKSSMISYDKILKVLNNILEQTVETGDYGLYDEFINFYLLAIANNIINSSYNNISTKIKGEEIGFGIPKKVTLCQPKVEREHIFLFVATPKPEQSEDTLRPKQSEDIYNYYVIDSQQRMNGNLNIKGQTISTRSLNGNLSLQTTFGGGCCGFYVISYTEEILSNPDKYKPLFDDPKSHKDLLLELNVRAAERVSKFIDGKGEIISTTKPDLAQMENFFEIKCSEFTFYLSKECGKSKSLNIEDFLKLLKEVKINLSKTDKDILRSQIKTQRDEQRKSKKVTAGRHGNISEIDDKIVSKPISLDKECILKIPPHIVIDHDKSGVDCITGVINIIIKPNLQKTFRNLEQIKIILSEDLPRLKKTDTEPEKKEKQQKIEEYIKKLYQKINDYGFDQKGKQDGLICLSDVFVKDKNFAKFRNMGEMLNKRIIICSKKLLNAAANEKNFKTK